MKLIRALFIPALLAVLPLLGGCTYQDFLDLKPDGLVAFKEEHLLLLAGALMLIVLIPVFFMTVWVPWKYRAGNTSAHYAPKWAHSSKIEWIIWMVPGLIVLALATITWIYTHRLDPYKPLPDEVAKPLEVKVIALDWKWLFIYPEQNIAVVNELNFPVNRPVHFDITSDTVMNSFFIPQLGGQIYAMAGMKTQLTLIADKPGTYFGENSQFSGRGFPYQNFKAIVGSKQDFNDWVAQVKQSPKQLDTNTYHTLEKPSVHDPVTYYASSKPGIFDQVLREYMTTSPYHENAISPRGELRDVR